MTQSELRLPALEVQQGEGRTLYSFAVDGKLLPSFATISRIRRGEEAEVQGYQRPEVLTHIAAIRRYLESEAPMIPNALVVAFDSRVRFEPLPVDEATCTYSRPGTLVVPNADTDDKPGWIVDGQQRCAAIREARLDSFPICVTAFITESAAEQRSQFILVNSAKPLPKALIYELLPSTNETLPLRLQHRRLPARLLERLNWDEDSPLFHLVQTVTTPEGVIKDNSLLRMLENSVYDGALYRLRQSASGEADVEAMVRLLKTYWRAVAAVFPDAWGVSPRRSRLMHGVGIVALGFLMDAIADRHSNLPDLTVDTFAGDLAQLKDLCRWTDGYWCFGPQAQRKWNELQNTSKDVQLLSNYLLFEYKARVWRQAVGDRRDA